MTGIQWIASEAWVTASLLTTPRFHALLGGTLGFSFPGVEIPGLKEFLINVRPSPEPGMEFVNMFWEDIFGCVLKFTGEDLRGDNVNALKESMKLNDLGRSLDTKPICNGSEDLRYTHSSYIDVSQVRISYSVYKAVYAIAHALHSLLKCESPVSDMDLTCKKHEPFTSKQVCCYTNTNFGCHDFNIGLFFSFLQLLQHLKSVNFTNQFKEKVYFDEKGEPVPLYDIINWQKDSRSNIRCNIMFVFVNNSA